MSKRACSRPYRTSASYIRRSALVGRRFFRGTRRCVGAYEAYAEQSARFCETDAGTHVRLVGEYA